MASTITIKENDRIGAKLDAMHRQMTMESVIKKMNKLQEHVDKNGWDAFVGCLYVHGGGFFYLGKYFVGLLTFIGGYAITLYGGWLLISSALSYIWQFERCWWAALWWIVAGELYDVVLGVVAGIMAKRIRERARFELELLHESYAARMALADY